MKTVLFISYYFPPSGGSGVQRGVKFVRYLSAFGWKPIVLTVDPTYAAFPAIDETLVQELPSNLEIHRTKAFNPFQWYAKLRGKNAESSMTVGTLGDQKGWQAWLRANLLIPDARVGWNKFAIQKGLELIQNQHIDAIITTSPPHSTHLIGKALHEKTGIAWLADFRDPWTDISYYKELPHTTFARKKDANFEKSVLETANRVTVVTPYYLDLMRQKVRNPEKFVLLRNGFDVSDLETQLSKTDASTNFIIQYVGSLFINPENVWKALAICKDEMPELRLHLTGRIENRILENVRQHGLSKILQLEGYVTHAEAVTQMQNASILLLVVEDSPHTQGILTGKIYEYIATGRPILGILPLQGDAMQLLKETHSGVGFAFEDVEGILYWLRVQYANWKQGDLITENRSEKLQPYTRKALTQQLAHILNGMKEMQE